MNKERYKLIPAVYVFLRRDNKILLLKRANTGYQDGNYAVPAGHMDGGALATSEIQREAKEEVGVIIKASDLKFVHVTHRLNGSPAEERVDFFFEAWNWKGRIINKEPHKCDDLAWFELNKLPKNMVPYIRLVLEKVLSGESYSEYTAEP